MNIVKVLKENTLFKGMDEKVVNVLASIAETVSVPPETVIFAEGMPANAMFIIISGRVEILKDTRDKKESVIGELSGGDVLGLLSLFLGGERQVTVRAKEDVELLTISKEGFDRLVKNNIHAAYYVLSNAMQYVVNILNSPEGLKGMIQ
ncbi:MAG: cyclic nucleotide-binding domain-containing protein [bacterium]